MAALANLRLIIRTAQRHSARIEKTCGVSGAQLWVMQELRDAPGLRIDAIAARLGIHQTTASNLVVGPNARMTVYANEQFQGKSQTLNPGQRVNNLRKELGLAQSIDSLRINCQS
jgi:hypothetical protein